jgi:SagB-type dehydrogenase family enzyme
VTEAPAAAGRQTARWLELVYGGRPDLYDPAEYYHEASKVSPSQIGRQVAGAARLEATPDLQLSMGRAVRRLPVRERDLPPPRRPELPLWEAIACRRSCRRFAAEPIQASEVAGLLEAAYGVTHALEAEDGRRALPLRAVPSGGALYPLELYLAALQVDGLGPGLYHFDPLRPALAVVGDSLTAGDVAALSTYPEIVGECAAVIFVAAVFGRTRFKYGVRGYRFALLEAGHVGQNVLLAATAFGLGAVPLGGYYDRLTDQFLGLDGVNESTLYTIAVGKPLDG